MGILDFFKKKPTEQQKEKLDERLNKIKNVKNIEIISRNIE